MPTHPIGSTYRRALLAARDHGHQLNRQGVERLYRAFAQVLNRLAAEEGTAVLTAARAERLRQEVDTMLRLLQRQVVGITEESVGRTLVDLTELHRRATEELFRQHGRGVALSASFDSVPARALASMMSRPNAQTFQTLINRRISALAPEIDTFLDAAVARGVSAGRGAKDLARIMARDDDRLVRLLDRADVLTGDLHRGAGAIDYAAYGMDEADTKALRGLLYDARRIQITESNNAMRAANAAAMDESPVVLAAKWQLSGRHSVADLCDTIAATDAYGFGPGMYPPSSWPVAPHPHCGCYSGAVKFRSPSDWGKPKPAAKPLGIDPTDSRHTARWASDWTENQRDRYQQQFAAILAEGERSTARRIPMGSLAGDDEWRGAVRGAGVQSQGGADAFRARFFDQHGGDKAEAWGRDVTAWMDSDSANEPIKADVLSFLRGERNERGGRLVGEVMSAPNNAPELYRGVAYAGTKKQVEGIYKVGSKHDWTISSFSSEKAVAGDFAVSRVRQVTGAATPTVFRMEAGAKAVNTEALSSLWQEQEWYTTGRFEVVEVNDMGSVLEVVVRQESPTW